MSWQRITVITLVVAAVGLLIAIGYYTWSEQQQLGGPNHPLTDAERQELQARLRGPIELLAVSLGILLIFSISLYAFMRWSRRFQSHLFRPERQETKVDDVWQYHRVPHELPPDPDDEEPSNGAGDGST